MLDKKINMYVVNENNASKLQDVALHLPILGSSYCDVLELGNNECGKLYSGVRIRKIPRLNGWTLQVKIGNQTHTIAHNTVRRNNWLKAFTGEIANKKNVNTRLQQLEQQTNVFGKLTTLNDRQYLAISNEKDGSAQLLPLK